MTCEGRVAIVTGAAGSGMGRSIVLTLAREGARVVVNYRTSQAPAKAIVEHITSRKGNAVAVQADIFAAEGCRKLVAETVARFGQVDICVIGPGGGWRPDSPDQLQSLGALEDLRQETAPLYYLMPLLLPSMYARKWGRIIGIALHPDRPSPAYAYNVGKAARLEALLLAHEQAWRHGVTLNAIAPGPVPVIASLEEAIAQCDHGATWPQRLDVSPQDIAEGVAFLCSESGRFVTGCALPYSFKG